MYGSRVLCCIGIVLLAGGCVIGEVDTPLERLVNFPFMGLPQYQQCKDDNSWSLNLIDEQTQEPLANIEIVRLDPIPFRDSVWSLIWYGEDDYVHKKLTHTDRQGNARISKSEKPLLEAWVDAGILRFEFDQQQATLTPYFLSDDDARVLKMHEIQPGHFTILIPAVRAE